jgi:hypothetical protein
MALIEMVRGAGLANFAIQERDADRLSTSALGAVSTHTTDAENWVRDTLEGFDGAILWRGFHVI